MTMALIRLPPAEFMEPKGRHPEVDMLVRRCLADRQVLAIGIDGDGAILAAAPMDASGAACIVVGRWRSPHIASMPTSMGGQLLLPFLCWIESLTFSPQALTTLGRESRPISDLVLRLYMNAVIRRLPVRLALSTASLPVAPLMRDLARSYRWLAKSSLGEDLLSNSDAAERLLVNAHLPVFPMTSALLRGGMAPYRADGQGTNAAACQRHALLSLRERWITEFKP